MSIVSTDAVYVIGVDTHCDTHTAAVLVAATGAKIATFTCPATRAGYAQLLTRACTHAPQGPRLWAVEGTGSYGAGLTVFLQQSEQVVAEIDHPARPARRNGAKNDALDAERAARVALSRPVLAEPRCQQGLRHAIQQILMVRRSAMTSHTRVVNQLKSLIVTVQEPLRTRLRDLNTEDLIAACRALRRHPSHDLPTAAAITALRTLATRAHNLATEIDELTTTLRQLVEQACPELLELQGVGPVVAGVLLAAWSHPGRIHSEAAFAMLAGAAPIPASSGNTQRHRLNRSGDRQLNSALHTVLRTRKRWDPATKIYVTEHQARHMTDGEINRALKRTISRQLFRFLQRHAPLPTPTGG